MIKKIIFFLFSSFFIFSCSFDKMSGIWSGTDNEKRRLGEIQKDQQEKVNTVKLYSTENTYNKEVLYKGNIKLPKPIKNTFWENIGFNDQNLLTNFYLPDISNRFLKKKVGKNKFPILKTGSVPIVSDNLIFLSNDRGTIFSINRSGSINWKTNIYKKMYKNIYKNLSIAKFKNNIYVSDNIGFIYALSSISGKVIWIKNHGIPLKSKMKVFDNKIILINQDNRILCLNISDGTKVWDVRSVSSFIKSQKLLSTAISNKKKLYALTSSGDLIKINIINGRIEWALSTLASLKAFDTDFFSSSDIVIDKENLFLAAGKSFFSFNNISGVINWKKNYSTTLTPISVSDSLFLVTDNGYLLNINKSDGDVNWSINILKHLKRKKRDTLISGFILGSGKIYATTVNGYLIVTSVKTGEVVKAFKVADSILTRPIIVNGALYIQSSEPKIIGLN